MGTEYRTKDLAEAGALLTKKQQLVRIDRTGSICWFVFKDKTACLNLSTAYMFGELPVNARDYYEALNRLKNRIFAKET